MSPPVAHPGPPLPPAIVPLVQLPHSGITQTRDKKSTYLDTVGRPVLVLTMHNVVPEHNKPFGVDYSFSAGAMMREPLLLVAGACSSVWL